MIERNQSTVDTDRNSLHPDREGQQ